MRMPDVNILVYAHREGAHDHARYAAWLHECVTGSEPFALSESVLHGFIRLVTNRRVFNTPSTLEDTFRFLDPLLRQPTCTLIRPGPQHWQIFRGLCESRNLRGDLIPDAAHAALAIESGCEWVTADTDFARFAPPLRWKHL